MVGFLLFFAKQGRLKIHDISRIVDAKAFVGFLVLYSKRAQFILVHIKEINKKIEYMWWLILIGKGFSNVT